MKLTADIVQMLLSLSRACALLKTADKDQADKLHKEINHIRAKVPPMALSHFDRIEALGRSGIAEIKNGKCTSCNATIDPGEINFLSTSNNIGVCDKCLAFIYIPHPSTYDSK